MRSIRRTLLLNVLLLLAVTLGVVGYVVYRTAEGAIRERQRSAREVALLRYADRRDEALRNRADRLASEVQSNWFRDKFRHQWMASQLAALSAPLAWSGGIPLATCVVTSGPSPFGTGPGPVAFEWNVRLSTELRLSPDEIYRDADSPAHEYVQLTGDAGGGWTSQSLYQIGHPLPLDVAGLRRDADFSPQFDDITLPNGVAARRVVLRAPVTRFSRVGSFWQQRPPRSEDSVPPSRAVVGVAAAARSFSGRPKGPIPTPPPFVGGPEYTLPNFYLQCAWDTSPDNPRLAPLLVERDDRLEEIDAETEQSVRRLQHTLGWTVAGTLAAILAGGWILVGLGLFPLKRLSYAVSQISAKDFLLPLDPRTLPAEVNPVAVRLSQALTELQAAFEREKRAAADISHELRTPLAALTTTIEVACRKPRAAEEYRAALDECRAIAKQMSQLVERMLVLAWIDAGADEVRPEPVEVGELVGGVAAIAKPLAEVQGLSFKCQVPRRLTVVTDPDKLREVVMNLTHNAIEYNRPGGEVELTATPGAKGGLVLEVRDTGIGMPAEIHEKIFERFFRGDPSRQATGVHAGLGLAIVKEYVHRLGGRLTVDSAVGRGSRFRIELPNAL
ncbi:MAG: HAMP domain-containing histidine kinase [Zavarzinella sp.]|nr:HAMP domain-containing histidine kinase [Zavarzinella sp.]